MTERRSDSFVDYIRAFGHDWLTAMSGPVSVPFLIAATYFSGWSRALLLALGVTCIIFASFRVWKTQQAEIVRLSVRPYDDALRARVLGALHQLGADGRDVFRYLLQFGEREQQTLYADAGIDHNEFGQILTRINETGLLSRDERQRPGRAGLDSFWSVNRQFVDALRDQVFPRQELTAQRSFPRMLF